jgi:hypothetical protein
VRVRQQASGHGKVTKFVADPNASHKWLSVAPAEVTAWFTAH